MLIVSTDQTHFYVYKGLDGQFPKNVFIFDLQNKKGLRDEPLYFSEALACLTFW